MTSTLPPLIQAFSGAFGSATANAVSYPLDLVSARIQSSRSRRYQGIRGLQRALQSVTNTRGFAGLYDGLPSDTGATLLSNFLYFYAYSYLRAFLISHKSRRLAGAAGAVKKLSVLLSIPEELAIGLLAGVASRAISTPLSLITVQLQTQSPSPSSRSQSSEKPHHIAPDSDSESDLDDSEPKNTVLSVMHSIYAHDGLAGFWRGFGITAALCLNPALTFLLYQAFRRVFIRDPKLRASPSPKQAFVGAAFSNAIAVAILYPLILAKTRLQAYRRPKASLPPPAHASPPKWGAKNAAPSDANLIQSVIRIWTDAYRTGGLHAGLYRGIEVQILKGFVSQGVTMMVKQRIEDAVVAAYLKRVGKGRK